MVKGKTSSGFRFTINPEDVNDMDFLERLGQASADITKMPAIIKEVLGEDQRKKMYDHLRTESGKVPIDKAMELFQEILTVANEERETKNS